MFCPQCRAVCVDDSTFCHKCGTALPVESSTQEPIADEVGKPNASIEPEGGISRPFPWKYVMAWAGAGFIVGALLGDAPRHVPGIANLVAYKVMAGLMWGFLAGMVAVIISLFKRAK